jgi:nitroreductase
MLVAHSLGLGTVWVGAFDEKEVGRILNVPGNVRPVAIVPVGYPDESPPHPGRFRKEQAIFHVR